MLDWIFRTSSLPWLTWRIIAQLNSSSHAKRYSFPGFFCLSSFNHHPIVTLLLESMKSDDCPNETIFDYFNHDEIKQIIAFISSFSLLENNNIQLLMRVAKLMCVYSSSTFNQATSQNLCSIRETLVIDNSLSYFIINGKNVIVITAYATMVLIIIKNEAISKEFITNRFKRMLNEEQRNPCSITWKLMIQASSGTWVYQLVQWMKVDSTRIRWCLKQLKIHFKNVCIDQTCQTHLVLLVVW